MKKLLVVLALAALGVALARRFSAQQQHGTPDSWPPVARKD